MTRHPTLETLRRVGRATPWLSLAACGAALVLSNETLGPQGAYALAPARLFDGELYRAWTGHFVHYGAAHLWGDLLAFAVWAAAVELTSRRLLAVTLFCATPLLSLAILLACPELNEYRGLSALDCAVVMELILVRGFGVGVLRPSLRGGPLRALALVSLLAFALKCTYEFLSGRAIFVGDLGSGVTLVAVAHPLGALAGLAAVAVLTASPARALRSAP